MNRIQMISQDLQIRRIKLAMGLDPQADINPQQVRNMWQKLKHENLMAKLSSSFSAAGKEGSSTSEG